MACLNITDYKKLKKIYDDAVKSGVTSIDYEGSELLISYLKYVLEYFKDIMESEAWKKSSR